MDSFIVRVYRYIGDDPQEITGLVEDVETQMKRPFHSTVELLNILTNKNHSFPLKPVPTDEG